MEDQAHGVNARLQDHEVHEGVRCSPAVVEAAEEVVRIAPDRPRHVHSVSQIIPQQIGGGGVRNAQAWDRNVRSRGSGVESVGQIARRCEDDADCARVLRSLAFAAGAGRAQIAAAAIQQSNFAGHGRIRTWVVYSARRHIDNRRRDGRDRGRHPVHSASSVFFSRKLAQAQAS